MGLRYHGHLTGVRQVWPPAHAPSPQTRSARTRSAHASGNRPQLEHDATGETRIQPEDFVLCRTCAAEVARQRDAISVRSQHCHVCVNPEGISFDIACYRTAAGCRALDEAQTFWSWFPGYAWRLAICRACATQLGWSFASERDAFFGLIRARLLQP
jgi:hypothetical protein